MLIIPIFVAVICMVCCYNLSHKEINMKRIFKMHLQKLSDAKYYIILFSVIAFGQIIFFLIAENIIYRYYADSDGSIPSIVMIIISFCSSVSMLFYLWSDKISLYRLAVKYAVLSIVIFLAEIIIFNGKSFTQSHEKYILTEDNIQIETTDTAVLSSSGEITISGDATLTLQNLPKYTHIISLDAEQSQKAPNFRVQLKMCDGNFSDYYQTPAYKLVGGHGLPGEFSILPYGEIRSLELVFKDIRSAVTLHSVTAMNCIPFRFSLIRYIALFGFFALVFIINTFGLAKLTYDRTNFFHRIAVIAMTIICVTTSLFFYVPNQKLVEYPMKDDVEEYDPYIQTFDAFKNNRAWLDVIPDGNLETLENVYDTGVRRNSGFDYLWDRAYFQEKYYSYYGVTPVFMLYYPVYFFTGKLPTLTMANGFFGALSILFVCLAILAVVRLFVPKANLLLLLLAMASATCLSGAYFCFQYPNMYDVVVASGICFLFLTIWLGMRACFTQRKTVKLILLIACGISLGLCAGSRPSMAIGGLVLAPLFLVILLDRNEKLSFRIGQAAAFLLPVCAVAAGLMYYNYLRFGSLLDFGANYQITVSDIHANHLRLSAIFPAIYHYFLQPVGISSLFPFFKIQIFDMWNYGMFSYADMLIGAFWFPMLFMGFVLIPKSMRMNGSSLVKFRKRGFIIACFALAAGIAWADFCLAGMHIRYLLDIMPLMILGSTCTILLTTANPKRMQYKLAVCCNLLSILFICLIMFTDAETTLMMNHQNLYEILEDLIVFWQ